jgi:hypothetical protein
MYYQFYNFVSVNYFPKVADIYSKLISLGFTIYLFFQDEKWYGSKEG